MTIISKSWFRQNTWQIERPCRREWEPCMYSRFYGWHCVCPELAKQRRREDLYSVTQWGSTGGGQTLMSTMALSIFLFTVMLC